MYREDHRTALNVLKDEAALQGIYPPTKIAPTTPDGQQPYPGLQGPVLSWRERLVRIIIAESKGDRTELRLLEQTARYRTYRFADTQIPQQMLYIMALVYVSEQLEEASAYLLSLWSALAFGDDDLEWDFLGLRSSYRFRIGVEGWRMFCEEIGVDADYLVEGNFRGVMLKTCSEHICKMAPTAEQMKELLEMKGHPNAELVTADDLRKGWRRLFAKVCHD